MTTIRALQPGETDLFLSYDRPSPPVTIEATRDFREFVDRGEYRPAWTWVALDGERVVARCAFWAGPDEDEPQALDWFDAADPDVGTELLRTALAAVPGTRPEYHQFVPPGWEDDEWTRTATRERIAMAQAAGWCQPLLRYSYEWSRTDRAPATDTRLRFEPAPDADLLPALRTILTGTLDDASVTDIAAHGVDRAAEIQLEDLAWFPSPRDWWRLAYDADDALVGVVVPARNFSRPVVGYLGVVPQQRGHGYVDDLLAYCTALLAREMGADERIAADTDQDNVPMAAAFTRAGYRAVRTRIVLA